MSILPTQSPSNVQSLATNVLQQFDTDRDGRLSVSEFSQFLNTLLDSLAGGDQNASSLTAGLGTSSLGTSTPQPTQLLQSTPVYAFAGFDPSRAQSAAGTLKYDAYNVLQTFDPSDPTAMQQAYQKLNTMHPGEYQIDAENNLMLTGTADGYIGARPLGYNGSSWDTSAGWQWQWFAYNAAHPGPNGETS